MAQEWTREDHALRGAARKHFGGWRRALLAAGLLPAPRREWTAQRVLTAIQAWQHEHSTTVAVWRDDPGLYAAAKRYFGTWSQALLVAGLRLHRKHWSSQRVIEAIRSGLSNGGPMAAIWSDRALASAAVAYFGGRNKALSAAGFQPRPQRRWTKAMVVKAIQARHQQGLPMANVGKWDRRLASAAYRQFGSWHSAMEASGLGASQRKWSKQRIVAELRARHHRVNGRRRHRDRTLDAAAMRYFGSVRSALLAAGIDPDQSRWTKQRVTEAIQDRYVRGLPMLDAQCEDQALVAAGRRIFGNWCNALAAAGLDKQRIEATRVGRKPIATMIPPRGANNASHATQRRNALCPAKP